MFFYESEPSGASFSTSAAIDRPTVSATLLSMDTRTEPLERLYRLCGMIIRRPDTPRQSGTGSPSWAMSRLLTLFDAWVRLGPHRKRAAICIVAILLLENYQLRHHIVGMQHLTCSKCRSEYDLKRIFARDWRHEPHDTRCEVCGTVVNRWDSDHEDILIMTKRGEHADA